MCLSQSKMSQLTPSQCFNMFVEDIKNIEEKGKVVKRKQFGKGVRYCHYGVCIPIICSPCITWSALWRVICCPISFLISGPSLSCSSNNITKISDKCICMCIEAIEADIKPNVEASNIHDKIFNENILKHILTKLSDPNLDMMRKYKICDYSRPFVENYIRNLSNKQIVNMNSNYSDVTTPERMRLTLLKIIAPSPTISTISIN